MKKSLKWLLIIVVSFILTGCMKMNIAITITDEKTAKMSMKVLYAKEFLEEMGSNEEDIIDQFNNGKYKDWQLDKHLTETIDGKEYLGVKIIAPTLATKEFLKNLEVSEKNGKKEYILTLNTSSAINSENNTNMFSSGQYSLEQMKALGLETVATIEMPGKITKASIGTVKDNTVIVDLLEASMSGKDIIITSGEKGSNSSATIYLYAAFAIALVAILAISMVLWNRKKRG